MSATAASAGTIKTIWKSCVIIPFIAAKLNSPANTKHTVANVLIPILPA
ncbi:MAG TPA: hypothetical protein PL009_07885 [Flavipsychrobacter sp.]|nr:hypothetical protein [Flavipsychrobacter sp.]